ATTLTIRFLRVPLSPKRLRRQHRHPAGRDRSRHNHRNGRQARWTHDSLLSLCGCPSSSFEGGSWVSAPSFFLHVALAFMPALSSSSLNAPAVLPPARACVPTCCSSPLSPLPCARVG